MPDRRVPADYVAQLEAAGKVRAAALDKARPELDRAEHALELGVELLANARRAGREINVRDAARLLGVSRQTLHARLRALEVPRTGTGMPHRGTK